MATIAFTALGTALGGPLGGALGSLAGNQLDRAIIGGQERTGPRIKELSVTTSSYGTPLPRHYGKMRVGGSMIWATDLKETSEKSGGSKGRPSLSTYSYAASFAIALSSRPIQRVGRIWADGNLLRGAAGDLKVAGQLRIYTGHGDQRPDPLIASDVGASCPAFRGRAYCVFEALQLAEFGNRIPSLSFEIIADNGEVRLADLLEPLEETVDASRALPQLTGFSDEGGPLSSTLATIDQLYPLAYDAGGEHLSIYAADEAAGMPPLLTEPAIARNEDGFGAAAGKTRRRQTDAINVPDGVRYYDMSRDYQAGIQRAEGRARPGRSRVLDFPGALSAQAARNLANAAADRAGWARDTLSWRTAELDPQIRPGAIVRIPDNSGYWRIECWEWCESGVELELRRLPRGFSRITATDPGTSVTAPDLVATPTKLAAFELPWDGAGSADVRQVFAAASSQSRGWTGAALFAEQGTNLVPIGSSGSTRSVLGHIVTEMPPSRCLMLERAATIDVELVSEDFSFVDASPATLSNGANRAIIGGEIIQFCQAQRMGDRLWRFRGLLRGRGGTEAEALAGHAINESFALVDDALVAISPAELGQAATIFALGLADQQPVGAPIINPGLSLRPLSPAHARVEIGRDGGMIFRWVRRARGAWNWVDGVDAPLVEQREAYLAGVGDLSNPDVYWSLDQPQLELSAAQLETLNSQYATKPLWVRQIGVHALSPPLLLSVIG